MIILMVHRTRAMIGQLYTMAKALSGIFRAHVAGRIKKMGATPVFTGINAHQSDIAGLVLPCVQFAQRVVVNPCYGFAQGTFIAALVFRQLRERARLPPRTGSADS